MLSIIIPTLNEEKLFPLLLKSIKEQSFSDYEIIVADAGSKDRTVKIAESFGCKVIKGGLPAKGRNEGARHAQGELMLFLDADVVLSEDFLNNSLEEFKKRKLEAASFFLEPFPKNEFVSFLINFFYNRPIKYLEHILPHGAMGILIKKKIHEKLGGFNEEVKIAEDHYYLRRASKISKFGLIKNSRLYTSTRRFEKDGWVNVNLKYILIELHMVFRGPVKSDLFKYKFGNYSKEKRI